MAALPPRPPNLFSFPSLDDLFPSSSTRSASSKKLPGVTFSPTTPARPSPLPSTSDSQPKAVPSDSFSQEPVHPPSPNPSAPSGPPDPPSGPPNPPPGPSIPQNFIEGFLQGPNSYINTRQNINTEFLTPVMHDALTISNNVGLSPMFDFTKAAYQALPTDAQNTVQNAASKSAGTMFGSIATGTAVNRVVNRIPHRGVRFAATLLSHAMTFVSLLQGPRRVVDSASQAHPNLASAASTSLNHIANHVPAEQQRAAVIKATQKISPNPTKT